MGKIQSSTLLLLVLFSLCILHANGTSFSAFALYFKLFSEPGCNQNVQTTPISYEIICSAGEVVSINVRYAANGVATSSSIDWINDFPNLVSLSIKNISGPNPVQVTNSLVNHKTIQSLTIFAAGGVSILNTDMRNMTALLSVNLANISSIPTLPTTVTDVLLHTTVAQGVIQQNLFNPNLISYNISANSIQASTILDFSNSRNIQLFAMKSTVSYPMDYSVFFNLSALQTLSLNGIPASPTTLPPFTSVSWGKLKTLELIDSGLTGTLDPGYFYLPLLTSFTIVNSPSLSFVVPNNIKDTSLITFNITKTGCGGTLPVNIINRITRLDIRSTQIRGALPTPFLCMPPELLSPSPPTKQKYLFDKVFTNYNATYQALCAPNITSISPYPIQVNSTITLTGDSIAGANGYYTVQMSNDVGGQTVSINCALLDESSIICQNGEVQGEGTLTVKLQNGKIPDPQDSIDFVYQPPLILSATPCPTLGGTITLTGFDLVDQVGIQQDSGVTILGRRCENIQVIQRYQVVTCDYPAGIISDVPISFRVRGIVSTNSSVNFFYKAPYVISSNAILPDTDSDLTIVGTDFWNDLSLVSVTVGPNAISCPVSQVAHSTIICRFPATSYSSTPMHINVTVLGQTSQPNTLFEFLDGNVCPNACSGRGACSVSVGFCLCQGQYGPDCTQTPIESEYNAAASLPVLTISSESNKTQLVATLVSLIENGAETLIPSNWIVTENGDHSVYNWSSKLVVTIRKNAADTTEKLGGLNYTYPANSYSYSIQYNNALLPTPTLQFKFSVKTIPEECDTPPMTLAYPTRSDDDDTPSELHWSTLTQYNTQWMARYPQAASVNTEYGSVKSTVFSQSGSDQILLMTVEPGAAGQDSIYGAHFEIDFAAYEASDSRSPSSGCSESGKGNGWKIAVGVVVGVVGAVIIAGLLFYIFRQKTKLDETKRLLDKKLAELSGL